ncbi:MAG: peptide chain release factor 1 [Desulfobacterota bacterium]|nr:peptide chain release factor 1 [Thermodesulfobacteriota bacterium]MDW8001672.1 peptide chain release factor 1 [Deltaproteobacteria bacterium]
MFEKLKELEIKFEELEKELADPAIFSDVEKYRRIAKEHNELEKTVSLFREWKRVAEEEEKLLDMIDEEKDEELRLLAKEELKVLARRKEELGKMIRDELLKKDEKEVKSMFLEIRAGTGGEEAALFAGELLSAYLKYAEKKKWKTEIVSLSLSDLGGVKEAIIVIDSKEAYNLLRYESGVHRVQRVPVTEAQGRIHTSTVTVAVLPEPEETEIVINPEDLRIDVFRASGPGGQHVNKTESAVRITHIPTGIVVTCQDEKSQHKNKAKALRVLRARLKEMVEREKAKELSEERRRQVGTGERSEKIRTYNFPQGRVTDHRIGLTIYKIQDIMDGDLDEIIIPVTEHFKAEALRTKGWH